MAKRRNTAKTGDKKLYAGRQKESSSGSGKEGDDEPVYGEVDRFHNQRDQDFLKLEGNVNGPDDEDVDDGTSRQRHVLDLGIGGDDSSDAESSSDDEEQAQGDAHSISEADDSSASDGDSDDDDDEHDRLENRLEEDPRNWGRKKSQYYHGDTADLEIGQDEEDAYVEEEAAREVQSSRFHDMDDDDFQLPINENQPEVETPEGLATVRDISKKSLAEQRKFLKKQHPELLPLLSYFSDVVLRLKDTTQVATKALTSPDNSAESVGSTTQGRRYLLTKTLLENAVALNTALYLLLKSEESTDQGNGKWGSLDAHPVVARLKKCSSAMQRFEDHIQTENLEEQVSNLVKASELMASGDIDSEEGDQMIEELDENEATQDETAEAEHVPKHADNTADSAESLPTVSTDRLTRTRDQVLDEARFGLRHNEIDSVGTGMPKRTRAGPDGPDIGDIETEGGKSFLSTINAIEQRSKSRKRSNEVLAEHLDASMEENDELAQGLRLMEEELERSDEVDMPAEVDDEKSLDAEIEGDDYYAAVSRKQAATKKLKKSLYQVAPKFPGMEQEIEGERAISRVIMKNRGLVAHKSKINRNPRVKKREQYRKALIRRKGAVREVRTDESHKYGGEETGIKSRISRSRKLLS